MAPAVTPPITEKTRARTSHFRQDMNHPRCQEGAEENDGEWPLGPFAGLHGARDTTGKGPIQSTEDRELRIEDRGGKKTGVHRRERGDFHVSSLAPSYRERIFLSLNPYKQGTWELSFV